MRRYVPIVVPSALRGGAGHGGVRQSPVTVRGYVYAVYTSDDNQAPKNADPNTGIMCDVLLCEPGWAGLLRHVPVQVQSGGVANHEHWIPQPITRTMNGSPLRLEGGPGATPLHETDGDLVLVTFLAGDLNRPIITGQLPHPAADQSAADYAAYRYVRVVEGNVIGVERGGDVQIDCRGGGQKVTIQTDDNGRIVAAGKVVTITVGATTITLDGDTNAVVVAGGDTTIRSGKLISRSSGVAVTQPVVLDQARADIAAMLTTIGTWFSTYGAALAVVGACDPATVVRVGADLAKLTAAIGHTSVNTESD